MKVVLDTSVVVTAFRSPGGLSARTLVACRGKNPVMVITTPLLLEYEAVLSRPEHLAAAGASLTDVDRLLDAICGFAEPVTPTWLWRPQLKDPDDEMVLEASVASGADIITFNLRDFAPIVRFGLRAMTPRQFWKER